MKEIGFVNIRYWYQMNNLAYSCFDDYWNFVSQAPSNAPKLKALQEKQENGIEVLKEKLNEKWAEMSGSKEFTLFENLIIVAEKPQ